MKFQFSQLDPRQSGTKNTWTGLEFFYAFLLLLLLPFSNKLERLFGVSWGEFLTHALSLIFVNRKQQHFTLLFCIHVCVCVLCSQTAPDPYSTMHTKKVLLLAACMFLHFCWAQSIFGSTGLNDTAVPRLHHFSIRLLHCKKIALRTIQVLSTTKVHLKCSSVTRFWRVSIKARKLCIIHSSHFLAPLKSTL